MSSSFRLLASKLVYPWSMRILESGDIVVSERPGRLKVLDNGAFREIDTGSLSARGGLFDFEFFHNDDASSSFFAYTIHRTADKYWAEVVRGIYDGERIDQVETVVATGKSESPMHSGGRLLTLPDGSLLVSVGSRWSNGLDAQDPTLLTGKIIRISPSERCDSLSMCGVEDLKVEVFARGFRNVQGMAFDGLRIWATDHGPVRGDEINTLTDNGNYGWPYVTDGDGAPEPQDHSAVKAENVALIAPVLAFDIAVAPSSIAYSNGILYVASLVRQRIYRFHVGPHLTPAPSIFCSVKQRIRHVSIHQGELYVLTDSHDANLYVTDI